MVHWVCIAVAQLPYDVLSRSNCHPLMLRCTEDTRTSFVLLRKVSERWRVRMVAHSRINMSCVPNYPVDDQ